MRNDELIFEINGDVVPASCFFKDKKRRIYMVLVISELHVSDDKLHKYFQNLEAVGIEIEKENGTFNNKLTFVKLHLAEEKLNNFVKLWNIDCFHERKQFWESEFDHNEEILRSSFIGPSYSRPRHIEPNIFKSSLIITQVPKTLLFFEKVFIVNKILRETYFGEKVFNYGTKRLINKKILIGKYTLHEGPWKWDNEDYVTKRQILTKYWSSSRFLYKQQPIHLIVTYFGAEIGFYFAILEFYLKMLSIAVCGGIVCILLGVITYRTSENKASHDICKSHLILCPRCHYHFCRYTWLESNCLVMYMGYLVDNVYSFIYGLFIIFWSIAFQRIWLRKRCRLAFLWNVDHKDIDITMRVDYERKATDTKISYITGQPEPYMKVKQKTIRTGISWITLFIMVLIISCASVGKSLLRLILEWYFSDIGPPEENPIVKTKEMYSILISSTITTIIIFIFTRVYIYVSELLTNFETPRTNTEYYYSFVLKLFILEFFNHFSDLFYTAFVKGNLFTHPGDYTTNKLKTIIKTDTCGLSGCMNNLHSVIIIRTFFYIVKSFIGPYWRIIWNHIKCCGNSNEIPVNDLPQWEADYYLRDVEKHYMVKKSMKLVMIHGYVTMFAMASPLVPTIALLYCLMLLKRDSKECVQTNKRTISRKTLGVQVWDDLYKAITYISILTNAFVVAFTSNFVDREVYRHEKNSSLYGFLHSRLSAFNVSDFKKIVVEQKRRSNIEIIDPNRIDTCYYEGRRYPPQHPNRYEPMKIHWVLYFYKFLVIIILEHLVLLVIAILEFASSPISYSLKQRMRLEWIQKKEAEENQSKLSL